MPSELPSATIDYAVLLAAGRGSRLQPLTDLVPKPLLPIDGAPVIGTLVDQLHARGIRRATVVRGHLGDVLSAALPTICPPDFALEFVDQAQQAGSADALQCVLTHNPSPGTAFVAATDTVFLDSDIDAVLATHARTQPLVTMGIRRWPREQLPHRSCVRVDADLRLERIMEKPADAEIESAFSGSPIYVFAAAFWSYVAAITPSSNGMVELASGLQAAIDDGAHVQGVEVHDTRDITRPSDLLRENFPYLREFVAPLA